MAPRNNDANTNYKKTSFPGEDNDVNGKDIVPCLLHKKHKVVKLVKGQMQKIQEQGLLCEAAGGVDTDDVEEFQPKLQRMESMGRDQSGGGGRRCPWIYYIKFALLLFLLLLIMVWISAGPLSNSIAHTPIPTGSFVRTESICSLEKKYLLRWSKPEYFE